MKNNRLRKILINNEFTSLGHILLPFLLAAVFPMLIAEIISLHPFFMDIDMRFDSIGSHTLIMHLLGWLRGLNLKAKFALKKRIANWALLITGAVLVQAIHYTVTGQTNLTTILDLILMCSGYFNGIVAADHFSIAATAQNQ